MTLAELDAMIDSTPGAAWILLVEGDWRATMRGPAGANSRKDLGYRVIYRGWPVCVASPGPSQLLAQHEMQAGRLGALGAQSELPKP